MHFRLRLLTFVIWSAFLPALPAAEQEVRQDGKTPELPGRVTGVKIYQPPPDWTAVFAAWRKLGVNTVLADLKLHADPVFRTGCREAGIRRFIIAPVFYNPEALATHPEWYAITRSGGRAVDDWVQFVCPCREEYRRIRCGEFVRWVREYEPDGFSLDFIRYFVYWEMVYPDREPDTLPDTCYCAVCRQRFQRDTGIRVPAEVQTPAELAGWIRQNCQNDWIQWKCQTIAGLVREITAAVRKARPGILINLHALPWRPGDFHGAVRRVAGQDLARLASMVDMLSPMTYHHMVKQTTGWITEVAASLSAAGRPVVPSIQVAPEYITTPLTVEEFRQALAASLRPPSRGVIFWNWEALAADPLKLRMAERILKSAGRP